ncbi:helix-turn-helix domain-containing protein [Chryseobacterium sp. HR92]|uniref:helix-turn-helix domain-containing protein n=1 Tax=Chryseobacterium sp. HR92 TaxID=3094839 RepID=UPI00388D4B20|nr:AraC family transcriptional regulator [Chryseobacterium sp. HR92]
MYSEIDNITVNTIDVLKRRCISLIVYVLCAALFLYSIIIYFIVKDKWLALSTFIYFLVLLYTYILIGKTYNIRVLVHGYLVFDPLFAAFIMLYFWKYSVGTGLWILPIPIGAYVFLERKYVYIYSSYALLIIVFIATISKLFAFSTPLKYHSIKNADFSDVLVGVANIIIVVVLLYYSDKIKSTKITADFEQTIKAANFNDLEKESYKRDDTCIVEKDDLADSESVTVKYDQIFQSIQNIVENQLSFKNADFTISELSHLLKINNLYIGKAIKFNGYSSFSFYINFCRIQHVKKLIDENDLGKVTLMYIFTASGFKSQSTFNRVFKQIEGITPTEYISSLKKDVDQI